MISCDIFDIDGFKNFLHNEFVFAIRDLNKYGK